MEKNLIFLKKMLKEQLCCLGRVFARHQVQDDVIWEVVKGFDVIYLKIKEQINSTATEASNSYIYKMEPHPGLMYLLEKLEKEEEKEHEES